MIPFTPHCRLFDTCRDTVVDERGSTQCVLSDAVLGDLTTTYRSELESLLSTGRVDLSRTDDDSSPGLLVCEWDDGEVMALIRHSEGSITSALTNDSPEAVEWARAQFERRREAAQDVPNPFE